MIRANRHVVSIIYTPDVPMIVQRKGCATLKAEDSRLPYLLAEVRDTVELLTEL